ncbi:DUF808 domain-containing protein [Teredinibacter sp. KSP-S5-2]|uniref:DUF808 domain-containing protein n=1 Tax=Teredinibacter sp. KSP-S5-2 TaxID=3034506 RepID=UPI002934DA72|nr:DUF808 domain-containing protein [Teredinibacter sp. KSP-S5-2]WNO07778.1 DUF808 domain-containing protein [Teredinibacter sp. KSP-S5-2]
MAAGSLLTLLDDIATLLDDIAVMSKLAAKKTAGVLGDDLAVNAEQVQGVRAERELPVVWAVAKGSFVNKLIIVPVVLLVSAFLPWLITPVLMIGGAYLCFEGAEKVSHFLFHHKAKGDSVLPSPEPVLDLLALEKAKISGAIRTDFILSLEIIVIALGTVQSQPMMTQTLVVSVVAVGITIMVYGLVAAIVKLDDLGLHLIEQNRLRYVGEFLLWLAPVLMKFLSVAGTLAMFLVGGGIITHGFDSFFHHLPELFLPDSASAWLVSSVQILISGVVGLLLGFVVIGLVKLVQLVRHRVMDKKADYSFDGE